ncbi:hypothetical protein HN747_04810 [archaeon]|jgi:hypothetical protein|nr:hypothetical protein [archaeon]
MKKVLIGIALVVVVLVVVLSFKGKKKDNTSEDIVYQNTISISRTYAALRVKTDKLLGEASQYPDYNTWDKEMTELLANWKNLESKASKLEAQANIISGEKTSFKLMNEAHAYTKDEISNVFDKAPAGKKIRTLAKYLGVDAKRAYKILQNDQEFVKADAWNEAGDTFKKLEVSAIVIKDGCKVAGFIGAAAMTGGATAGASLGSAGVGSALLGGSAGLTEGTIMIIAGTDLMLEVSEDAATISLGDNSKVTKSISKIRSVTDPAASLLSIKDIPKNISKGAALLDKVGVVLVQIDQIRSMTQDGKLLGINITPDSKIKVAAIEEDEMDEWIESEWGEKPYEEEGYSDDLEEWLGGFEDLDDWLDEVEDEEALEEEDKELATEEEIVAEDKETQTEETVNSKDENEEASEEALEEKDQNVEKVYTKDGKVSLSMQNVVEPLSVGHTKMWEVKVYGYERSGEKKGYECYWNFYTEYDSGVEPWMNLKGCKRLGGVPGKFRPVGDPPGELRVMVRVDFLEQDYGTDEFGNRVQDGKKVIETVTIEKTYVVNPWGEG